MNKHLLVVFLTIPFVTQAGYFGDDRYFDPSPNANPQDCRPVPVWTFFPRSGYASPVEKRQSSVDALAAAAARLRIVSGDSASSASASAQSTPSQGTPKVERKD